MIGYTVSTAIDHGDIIQQIDWVDDGFNIRENIIRQVLSLADKDIKDKLIELGWTPPQGE